MIVTMLEILTCSRICDESDNDIDDHNDNGDGDDDDHDDNVGDDDGDDMVMLMVTMMVIMLVVMMVMMMDWWRWPSTSNKQKRLPLLLVEEGAFPVWGPEMMHGKAEGTQSLGPEGALRPQKEGPMERDPCWQLNPSPPYCQESEQMMNASTTACVSWVSSHHPHWLGPELVKRRERNSSNNNKQQQQ